MNNLNGQILCTACYRKPPCLPPAKTKRYEVEHPIWQEPEDVKELLWRRHAYMDALNSVRAHFRREIEAEGHGEGSFDQMIEEEKYEFEGLLKENERINEEIALNREENKRKELELLERETLIEAENYLISEAELLKEKQLEVEQVLDDYPNFVTLENLEEKIVEGLKQPIDHNYAIDIEAHKYTTGKEPAKYLLTLPRHQEKYRYEETAGKVRIYGAEKEKPHYSEEGSYEDIMEGENNEEEFRNTEI